MKKIKYSITLFILTLSCALSPAQETPVWTIDKPHCFVNFSIGHMFSVVTGRFKDFEGDFRFNPNNLKDSKMDFTVKVNSVETDTPQRNEHLKTADFFDAKKYPDITFKSAKIVRKSKNKLLLYGKLTIKNITKDVILLVTITGHAESAMVPGIMVLGLDIQTVIKRSDYGVGAGKWSLTDIIGNDANLHIPLELNRPMKK